MADIKKLKVVLVKTPGEKIGGKSDNRRLIKSLNVRVHTFEYSTSSGKVYVEIWEPLSSKNYTDRQQEIFYKNAQIAICIAGKTSLNGCPTSFINKVKEAQFYLGDKNVLAMSDASVGIKHREGVDMHLTGNQGLDTLTDIQHLAISTLINE